MRGKVKFKTVGRRTLAAFFVVAGVLHFVFPATYASIVPAYLPAPLLLVQISGVAEMAGGAGLMMSSEWRRWAGIGLIALLIAVFPANIEMLRQAHERGASVLYQTALWLRLPLQPLMIYWVWRVSQPRRR